MIWIALIVGGAALVVLGAVIASGLGPLGSLRRSIERLDEVTDELERIRRNTDLVRQRADELARRAEGPEGGRA